MSIKKRIYYMGGKKHTVELKYDGYMYTVISDGVLFKQTLMNCLRFRFLMRFRKMEEIRTNMSKEDVVHNMLEIALYLAQQDKDAHEIDVNVKNLNMRFEVWMGETESED